MVIRVVDCYLVTSSGTTLFIDGTPGCSLDLDDCFAQLHPLFLTTMTTITRDISLQMHAELDRDIAYLAHLPFDSQASEILSGVINGSLLSYSTTTWPINATNRVACRDILASNQEIREILEKAHHSGEYSQIRNRGTWPAQFTFFSTDSTISRVSYLQTRDSRKSNPTSAYSKRPQWKRTDGASHC
jgi:hypothetical protein